MRRLVRSQTTKRLKRLGAELRGIMLKRGGRKPTDADAIHDLRVSIRRLRQELRVFQAWFEPDQVRSTRQRLRRLMIRCAAVRNCDVAIEVLRAAGWQDPKLFAGLEQERRRTREDLARTLERWRRRDRVRRWRGHLKVAQSAADPEHPGSPQESTEETARRLLPAMTEDLFRAGSEAARPDAGHRKMHQFRLKTKRVRYTLELFEKFYGRKTQKMMEALKGLQEKLGAINDCATTLEMIRVDRAAAAAVQRLAGKRATEFRRYWKSRFGQRERIQWKAALSAADGKR